MGMPVRVAQCLWRGDNVIDIFHWRYGGCQSPAVRAVEGYVPRGGLAHGSISRLSYCCAEHLEKTRQRTVRDGMSPYVASGQVFGERICGDVSDYVDKAEVKQ